jgi:signal peptidase
LGIVLVLTIFLSLFILAGEKIDTILYRVYAIETGSMVPTFNPGELIVVKRTNSYKVEDIITFDYQNSDVPITHRIVEIQEDGKYVTKGDDNPVNDAYPVDKDDVIGEVVYNHSDWGNIILFMKSVVGIIVLFIIPITVLLTLNIQSIYSWLKERGSS